MVVLRTADAEYTCQTHTEITDVLTEVLTDRQKAATLATGILEIAANRPEGVPPLIINLNKED